MGLTKSQSESLSRRVLDLVKADGASVWITDSEDLQLRYANNDITSNGLVDRVRIDLSVSYGKRSASIQVNQTDEETLRASVKKVQAMAKLAPEDPEHMPELDPGEYLEPRTFSEATAALTPEEGLARIRPVIEAARAAGVDSAGYLERSVSGATFANSKGLFVHQTSTGIDYSLTARAAEGRGSGWASTQVTDLGDLDLEPVGARAIEKALASRNAVERAPGRTTVVLEPAAVRDLVSLLFWGLGRRDFDEGRSFLNGLVKEGEDPVGKALFGEKATLYSDPQDPAAPCGIHHNGLAREKTSWVEKGVLKNLEVGRFWAQKKEISPQPFPGNIIMAGEGQSIDELVGQVEDGVLITRLWYLRMVQPQTLLYTGLTRDGTFAIKDGTIGGPVKNFRFNDSPVNILKNIVASGEPARVMGSEGAMPMYVPPLLVRDFNLSSVSDAS
ncbi:TldD/PmbA family protein [Verrucomicrobiales bacterium BCK34]|nr:TldD/PmbA family protein [Verrucomicrobiales bacterium BCK34]